MARRPLTCWLSVLLVTMALVHTTWAAETVLVDLADVQGSVTHRASGFLHSISPTTPAVQYVDVLKPQTFRLREAPNKYTGGALVTYDRIKHLGAALQLNISDGFGYGGANGWPGEGGVWNVWEDYVAEMTMRIVDGGYEVEWDIWNEPDIFQFWNPSGDPTTRFFETWRRAVTIIRQIDPDAVVVGPSTAHYGGTSSAFSVQQFLLYARDHAVLPDVLSWHVWDAAALAGEVADCRSFMAANGITIDRISLNEIVHNTHKTTPGVLPYYFAQIEAAQVDSACHACWYEEDGSTSQCFLATLDGLMTPDQQPRATWWVYKAYADITGELVALTATTNIKGLAGVDADAKQAHILVGRQGGVTSAAVTISGLDTRAFLQHNGQVRVVAQLIPNRGWDALAAPSRAEDSLHEVVAGSITVQLPSFAPADAYVVSLYNPIDSCGYPGTTYDAGDITRDCHIDLLDFAALTQDWQDCYNPDPAACN